MLLVVGLAGCLGDDESDFVLPDPVPTRAYSVVDVDVPSFDGHLVPASIHLPDDADGTKPYPVILHSHGFTGSRWQGAQADPYVQAGFAVLSFDERGHGDALDTSEVHFMHPDWEVRDVIALLDHLETLDWVLKENGDPVVGAIGGSYGGAYQLMTAAFDDRLDAIAPDMTWHDMVASLAPGGAVKSGWVNFFYVGGTATNAVTFSEEFHDGWRWTMATNELPAGQAPGVPDLVTIFQEASPASYPGTVDVPTLLLQGMLDTLFPLNEAVGNMEAIAATGAPVHLATHLGGHVLSTGSLGNPSAVSVGLQGAPGGSPCGSVTELSIAWHQRWLLGMDADVGSRVCIALEDGTAIGGDAFPLPSTELAQFDVGGPFPMAQAGGGTLVPLHTFTADKATVVAGIPRLSGTITSPGPDAIVYFSFQAVRADGVFEHIVNDQVMPLRIKGPNTGAQEFELDLGGIGTRLEAGDEITLMASSLEPIYFGNQERLPAGLVLDDLALELPIVASPQAVA